MNGQNTKTNLTAAITAVLLCALFFSCQDEDFLERSTPAKACDNICFGISPDEEQTRGNAGNHNNGYTSGRFVMRSEDSADTLCVRAIVCDGIRSSDFVCNRAATRGAPVSKNNFHNAFHVLAYWKKNGTLVEEQFYMDEDVTDKGNNRWSSETVYYWPGEGHTLQFYAWAPADAEFTDTPSAPASTTLSYTVPADAIDQKDIMVASPEETAGNHNAEQSLVFRHICTAVRFATGTQMQPGIIKSVALKGVRYNGIYDMKYGVWKLDESTSDFTQTVDKTIPAANEDITSDNGTFMMLPQTLPAEAIVEVKFINANNEERTLTASIGNTKWKMGTTVTYKLSITPEYELEFSEDNPTEADGHYIIVPIKINAKDLNNGNYTLVASEPAVCRLRENLVGPEEQGYWPKETTGDGDFARKNRVSSNIEGETVYYAFLTENVTKADREVKFELQYNGETVRTMTITQKCPNWIGDMGWECLEEDGKKPFGFAWTRKVEYKSKNAIAGVLISLLRLFGAIQSNPAVSFEGAINVTCTIDYSKAEALSNVYSETDGLTNTKGFSANSASTLTSLENTLGNLCNITSETGENINSTDFAALVCIKKNPCNVTKRQSNNGQVAYLPSFEDADIKWYLPASGQFTVDAGLNDQYWSSTAINDNTNAYSWNSSAISTPRMELHKVRAVRNRP